MAGASRTAVGVAALRAAHLVVDRPPFVLDDHIAIQLIDPDTRAKLGAPGAAEALAKVAALRAHVVVRSRFAEDCLADAVARGVTQYVLLGAGLDTFAWRQPAWASALRIYEVDQPASQGDKQERLARAGLPSPANLIFVPVDFATDVLGDRLREAGVDPGRPVFFSWLGVTPYLDEPAIDDVLRVIASGASGTEVVLTFAPLRDTPTRVAEMAAAMGEAFRSYFTPESLEAKLRGFGFADVSFLTPAEATARYFASRGDDLALPRSTSIARARLRRSAATAGKPERH
ncbi:MAG TPA: class I SAM-dependent methyltransferase [Vicinamibacterales bacterium]|nr:class I SAM-dependent methyltransferase [Vicinamibacterales bacterium]